MTSTAVHGTSQTSQTGALRAFAGATKLIARVAETRFDRALATAGIRLNGPNRWDPQVHDGRVFMRVARDGSLGAGESYVDGDWDCDALDELSERLCHAGLLDRVGTGWPGAFDILRGLLANMQSIERAFVSATAHYDRPTALYESMLGPSMTYSCGYWHSARTLDEAQHAKHDLIGRKIQLRPGQRVLDIGCGWGAFAKYAAERGAQVVGITVSPSQRAYAQQLCRGLPVEIRLADYRDVHEQFDRVVSVGMFEHVGTRNYRTYMRVAHDCLADDGLFLLHTIGSLRSGGPGMDPWFERYIFPGSALPSLAQLTEATEGLFVVEDVHNFGADYDRTLIAWRNRFDEAWPSMHIGLDERFRRMWRYYLSICAGAFRARRNQLWQVVLSKRGVRGGYARTGV